MLGSPQHQAALQLALKGIPVFPIVCGGKDPACPHGFHDATTDITQINAWWAAADFNLAIVPGALGLCVIDLDGPIGDNNWTDLVLAHETPPPSSLPRLTASISIFEAHYHPRSRSWAKRLTPAALARMCSSPHPSSMGFLTERSSAGRSLHCRRGCLPRCKSWPRSR